VPPPLARRRGCTCCPTRPPSGSLAPRSARAVSTSPRGFARAPVDRRQHGPRQRHHVAVRSQRQARLAWRCPALGSPRFAGLCSRSRHTGSSCCRWLGCRRPGLRRRDPGAVGQPRVLPALRPRRGGGELGRGGTGEDRRHEDRRHQGAYADGGASTFRGPGQRERSRRPDADMDQPPPCVGQRDNWVPRVRKPFGRLPPKR
jgi:hypothetical protein